MVFRFILRYLSNNEQLIQKLSESYPVRRAAQIFVSFYYRGQSAVEQSNLKHNLSPEKFRNFMRNFQRDFKQELENAKRELKERKK